MRSRRPIKFRTYGPELILDALEERIVLDASVAPTAHHHHHDSAGDSHAGHIQGVDSDHSHHTSGSHLDASANSSQSSVAQAAQVFNQDLNVVLISNALDHVDTIAQAVKHNAKVIVVDANNDTLQTVEQTLENLVQSTGKKIGTLTVVAHGTDGAVEIGADNIELANFFKYDSGLKTLSTVLAEGAQIQFYGCSLAGDAAGQSLLGKIANDTHATVFASTNTTGGAGNDWNLEYSTAPGTPMHVLLDTAKLGNYTEALSFRGTWPLSDPNQYNTYWGTVDANDPVGIDGRHAEFWTFYGTAGETVSLGMQTTRPDLGYGDAGGINIDTFLEVYNPDGTQAAQIDDWKSPPGTGNDPPYSIYSDSLLQWKLPQTGWYVVQACTWNLGNYGDYSLISTKDLTAVSGNNIQNKVDYRTVPDVTVDNNFTSYTYDMADFFGKPQGYTPAMSYSLGTLGGTLGAGTYTCGIDSATGLITVTHTGTGSGTLTIPVTASDGGTSGSWTFTLNVAAGNSAPYIENGGLPNINVWPGDSLSKTIDLKPYFQDWEDGDNLNYNNPAPTVTDANHILSSWSLDNVNKTLTLNYAAAGQGFATITVTGKDSGGLSVAETFTATAKLNEPALQNIGFDTGNTTGWTTDAGYVNVANVTATDGFPTPSTKMLQLDQNNSTNAFPSQVHQEFKWNGEMIQVGYDFFTYDAIGYDHFGYTITLNGTPIAYLNKDAGWSGHTAHTGNTLATTGWITDPVVDPAAFGAHIGDVIAITLYAGNDVTGTQSSSYANFDLQLVTTPTKPVSKGIADIEVIEDSANSVLNLYNAFFDAQTPPANMTYKYTITSTDTGDASLFAAVDGSAPSYNTLTTIGNASAFTLDYAANHSGWANIMITATDTANHSANYTFKVTARPAYDLPSGGSDQYVVVGAGQSQDITFTGNDPELFAAGQVKFITDYVNTGTGNLVPTGAMQNLGNGNWSQVWHYTPDPNFYGLEMFHYTLSTPTGTWTGLQLGTGATITKPSTTTDGTNDMQLADLNHDGYLDLVEANENYNGGTPANSPNYFFLNDGTGHFNAGVQIGNDSSKSVRLVLGDVNGDGYVDAVVANRAGQDDLVYTWNSGTNKFNPGVPLTGQTTYGTTAVALGDVNGDGYKDIVIGTDEAAGRVLVFLNDGTGHFGTGKAIGVPAGRIGAIGIGDFNGDGYVDIVVGKDGTTDDLIYLNNGAGSFYNAVHLPTAGRGNTTYLAVGDVDGDHNVDVVMGGNGKNRFYKNNGSNSFSYYQIGPADADDTTSIRLADLNKDGYLDVVAFNDYGTAAQADNYYLYTPGAPGIPTNPYQTNGTTIESGAIRDQAGVLGDINNDGKTDLVMGIYTTTNNPNVANVYDRVFLNTDWTWTGFETAPSSTITKPSTTRDGTNDMQLVDLNHDGYLDLVEANQRGDTGAGYANYFFLNDGTGHFNAGVPIGTDAYRSQRIVVGDLNGDTYMDAVVANNSGDPDMVYLWNPATSTFVAGAGTALTGTTVYGTTAVAIGDFNGDGHQDIAIATNEANGRVIIFQNPGSGNFNGVAGTAVGVTASGTIGALGVADMNRDGYVDIVVGKDATHDDMIYLNNGSGGFTNLVSLPTAGRGNTTYMALGDVDGDHNIDIVMGGNGLNRFYKNNGSLSFAYYRIGSTDAFDTASIRLVDLNKDGYLDVVAFNDYGTAAQSDKYYLYDKVNFYQANGTSIETTAIRDQAGAVGDINNDGSVDLIMGIYSSGGTYPSNDYDQVFLGLARGFNYDTVAQSSDPATINAQTELIKNWGFETYNPDIGPWKIAEQTTDIDPALLSLVGVVPNNTTIDMTTNLGGPVTITDLVPPYGTPLQFWALAGANPSDPDPAYKNPSITVYDPTGTAGDHILVSLDNGPRKDMIYQDVVIPKDPSVTQYTVTWRMAYWDQDFINKNPQFYSPTDRQPQYIALYVYDPTKTNPGPVWITQSTDPKVVSQLQDYSVTITDPALRGTTVRIGIEVFSGDNFLQVALDDFHINPTRSAISNPQAGLIHTAGDPFPTGPVLPLPPPMSMAMSMAAVVPSSDLELLKLDSSSGSSAPTLVSVLDSLSATSSSSLVSVLQQQASSASTTSASTQGTASLDQTQTAAASTTDTLDTGLVATVQQTIVVPDTTVQTQAETAPATAPDVVAPPADQTPQSSEPVNVILAGEFGPDLDFSANMVFDPDNLSPMQVIALGTEMDSVYLGSAGLQHLAAKLAGGRSGSINLDTVTLTEIFT